MAASSSPAMTPQELLERLNRCLENFKAEKIGDITNVYAYYPTVAECKLGSGSYGDVFRMKRIVGPEPPRVVKAIPKSRVCKNALQIHHVSVELAVTGAMQHENINRRVGLYHTDSTFYIVLELCDGRRPDLATRLYHVFAKYAPFRIVDVQNIVNDFVAAAPADETPEACAVREDQTMRAQLLSLGLRAEVPSCSDIFNSITFHKHVPAAKSLVLLKQVLAGIGFLHANSVVHRDIKTENVVFGEDRKSVPILAGDGKTVIGVRITEKLRVKLIDFGLVKFMLMTSFPCTPSPTAFNAALVGGSEWDSDVPINEVSTEPPVTLAVTPCGTELYCSLEVINSILRGQCGRNKYTSTTDSLPKFDVYGAGTVLYCLTNGRPPFLLPKTYRAITREEKLRQISALIERGPTFYATCPPHVQQFLLKLMENNPAKRPSASKALADPIFAGVTDEYTYEVYTDGRVVEGVSGAAAAQAQPVAGGGGDADDSDAAAAGADIADLMEVVRGREDGGDGAGKPAAGETGQ